MADLNNSGVNHDDIFAAQLDAAAQENAYIDRARQKLMDEFAQTNKRSTGKIYYYAAIGTMLSAAVLLFFLLLPDTMTVNIKGNSTSLDEGTWVSSTQNTNELLFSDGSVVDINKNSTIRILKLRQNGADLLLKNGELNASIMHSSHTKWLFQAGPYNVHVIGTAFNASWNPEDKSFNLKMHNGKVQITGPMLKAGKILVSGEEIDASILQNEVSIRRSESTKKITLKSNKSSTLKSSNKDDVSPDLPNSNIIIMEHKAGKKLTPSKKTTKELSAPPPDWRQKARAGDYEQAVALVEQLGFDTVTGSATSDDLMLLGDSARLGGNSGRAEQAYTILRARFPKTDQAQRAAFSVGRMYFNRGAYMRAAQWFRLCINDNLAGHMTREAAGRLIESLDKAGDSKAAIAASIQYLKVFPNGPHALLAKKIAKDAKTE
ncbi:MAG: FecR domain-containing protein [Deltaproteobacteria bacterium]|nr:FecR domain-containing protein [Deltaproteobacteria bacterium]